MKIDKINSYDLRSHISYVMQEQMAQLLRAEQKSRNATVVSVAHRVEFNNCADRTIRMN